MSQHSGAGDESIRLYSYVTSPYAMKVHSYLLYKRLPFTVHYVNPFRVGRELPMGRQIPVLEIDDETRNDSTPIGLWLDERFPDAPALLPTDPAEREEVIQQDRWVSEELIPTVFNDVYPRLNRDGWRSLRACLRLGYCVDQTTPDGLPAGTRFLWPLFIRQAGFIRRLTSPRRHMGPASSLRRALLEELDQRLGEQAWLAATQAPSLADLGAWPQFMAPFLLGLPGTVDFLEYPHIRRWSDALSQDLLANSKQPALVPAQLAAGRLTRVAPAAGYTTRYR